MVSISGQYAMRLSLNAARHGGIVKVFGYKLVLLAAALMVTALALSACGTTPAPANPEPQIIEVEKIVEVESKRSSKSCAKATPAPS